MAEMNDAAGRIIINTVGASAIWNINRLKEPPEGVNKEELKKSLQEPDFGESAVEMLLGIMKRYYPHPGTGFLPAEVTSLQAINLSPNDRLYFLAGTRTDNKPDEGAVCGEALRRYFRSQGYKAEFIPVPDFVIDQTRPGKPFVQPDCFLKVLDDLVAGERKKYPDTDIVINLTPGYKLTGIYAALVGLLYRCEIFYVQESMGTAYGLPVFPVDVLALGKVIKEEAYQNLPKAKQDLYEPAGQGLYSLKNLVEVLTRSREESLPSWQPDLHEVREYLAERFSLSELKDLIFDLRYDHEHLPHSTTPELVRELLKKAVRDKRLPDLLEKANSRRPDPAVEAVLSRLRG